jgi:hypothetical protein
LGILLAVLGPLLWLGLLVAGILETHINVYGNIFAPLAYMNQIYIILPNAAWLLAVLVTLTAMYLTMRPSRAATTDR